MFILSLGFKEVSSLLLSIRYRSNILQWLKQRQAELFNKEIAPIMSPVEMLDFELFRLTLLLIEIKWFTVRLVYKFSQLSRPVLLALLLDVAIFVKALLAFFTNIERVS